MAEIPPAATPYGSGYAAASAATALAGFWRRFAAYIIDAVALGVVVAIIQAILSAIFGSDNSGMVVRGGLVGLVLGVLYFGYMWSRDGQTLGYMAMGLRLVRASGGSVPFTVAVLRYVVIYLSFLLCALPAIVSAFMIGMSQQKQGIHDAMVGTLVVRA
jgi:uncharacterized RDD family membrane protein YckC